jgi:hypothetical protein
MDWYIVKIVYRIICGDGAHTAQFDEQLRLISAYGEKEAIGKAQIIGEQEAHSFYNKNEQLVHWQFVAISELYRFSEWIDGAELYSTVKETDDAESYISLLLAKAASLKQENNYLLNLV